MAILLSFLLFVVLLGAISYFGYRRYARPGRVYEQLGGTATLAVPSIDRLDPNEEPGLAVWVVEQIGEKMPVNPQDAVELRRDLIAAGYRSEKALVIYVGARVLACAGLLLLALVFRGMITSNPILGIVIPVAAGFLC